MPPGGSQAHGGVTDSRLPTKEPDMHPTATLPAPSKEHATCPWCRRSFQTVVALIDHVDAAHLAPTTDQIKVA